MSWDVLVIGGGLNGLAAAARLGAAGRRVCLLEGRAQLGGLAARRELLPGYSVPGLLHDTSGLRPALVKELNLTAHGLEFEDQEPTVLVPRLEGAPLRLPLLPAADGDAMIAALLTESAEDAARWPEFVQQLRRWQPFVERLLDRPPPTPDDLSSAGGLWNLATTGLALRRLGRRDMSELLRTGPMCVADWLNEWFTLPGLKAALAAQACTATWMGPWSAGTAGLLLMQRAAGGRSVRGGPAALAEAFAAAARAAGVETRVNAEVARIRVEQGGASEARVIGVTLGDGETLDAPVVLTTCDPPRAIHGLLERSARPAALAEHLNTWRCRGTTAKLHLALEGPLKFLDAGDQPVERALLVSHLDDVERAFDAVKYDEFSAAPVLDVWVPSISVASCAPAGCQVVSVLVHFAPYALSGGWTEARRQQLTDVVLAVLRRHTESLDERIVATELLTPVDLEELYNLTGGHPHHGEQALDQWLHMRPSPLAARYATPLSGLYLGGSGSHPGGGHPGSTGRLAAAAILDR